MRHMAPRYGADPDYWGVVGLLHDFDYERHPNPDRAPDAEHPATGVAHLRAKDFPADGCAAIMGHAGYTGVPRESDLARVLFAVDELAGFVVACAGVRPGRCRISSRPACSRNSRTRPCARCEPGRRPAGSGGLGVPRDASCERC